MRPAEEGVAAKRVYEKERERYMVCIMDTAVQSEKPRSRMKSETRKATRQQNVVPAPALTTGLNMCFSGDGGWKRSIWGCWW